MFSVECPGHGGRVLLSPESIVALVWGIDGMEVHWRCTCGETGVWVVGARWSAEGPVPAG